MENCVVGVTIFPPIFVIDCWIFWEFPAKLTGWSTTELPVSMGHCWICEEFPATLTKLSAEDLLLVGVEFSSVEGGV